MASMIHLKLTAICDGCGCVLGVEERRGTQEGFATAMFKLMRKWRGTGIMKAERAYRPTKHFCQPCADGVPAMAKP